MGLWAWHQAESESRWRMEDGAARDGTFSGNRELVW